MRFWVIVDDKGNFVMESNRKVPRLYPMKVRAEEKIKMLCMTDRWTPYPARLVLDK